MGTLVLSFLVMTMDKNGHITWPSAYSAKSKAILRKAIRSNLEGMLDDPLYPTHPSMRAVLTGMGDSVHIFPTRRLRSRRRLQMQRRPRRRCALHSAT